MSEFSGEFAVNLFLFCIHSCKKGIAAWIQELQKKKKKEIQEGDSKGQISRLHFHRKRIALGCFPDKPLLKCAESPPKNKGKKYKCQYPMDCYYLLLSLHLKSKC